MKNQKNLTYEEVSLVHLYLFKILGILPFEYHDGDKSSSFRFTLKNYCPGIFCHIVSTLYYTMYLGYGVRIFLEQGLDVEYVSEFAVVQGISLRYLILYLQRSELLVLTRLCQELWSCLKRDEAGVVRVFERKVYYLRNFFLWNGFVAVAFYILTAQIVRLPPLQANGTERRILPLKFYIDVQEEPWYLLVSVLQIIVCYGIEVILVGIETVGPFLLMMACGYLRIIKNRFLAMKNVPNDVNLIQDCRTTLNIGKLSLDEVLTCVKFHQKIIEFCEKIEYYTRSLFMVQVLCTVYNMSILGIKLLENDHNEFKYISLFVLNLMQFFTCQWIPQYLLNESEAISTAAYTASLAHSHYEHEANRMLLLTMMRAERPIQMTAGGYIKLSLETFKRMVLNAFSFFTVLRSFSV